jgi:hypothetical protein
VYFRVFLCLGEFECFCFEVVKGDFLRVFKESGFHLEGDFFYLDLLRVLNCYNAVSSPGLIGLH